MNRLVAESSPYLRQHAANPVDWYPWGGEAFERAKQTDKPVLLSVGYSSCHWCHVMAHESFEDEATAELMNRYFVNVKLDREERPDVDAVYMSAVQALTGHGGWPMTVWLTPDGRPFFAGTYFPKAPRQGMPSFTQVIESVHETWLTRRDDVDEQAARLTGAIARESELAPRPAPQANHLEPAISRLFDSYDPSWGGFGSAPKFPQAMTLDAALRSWRRSGDPDVLHLVMNTLDAMAAGGIYDHLGGGFARYSTDAQWMIPHFEKMLYDNALLARVYLHAWQATAKDRYLQVVREVFAYCCRNLQHTGGGFCSAEDADSEGVEGKFYAFSLDEVRGVLAGAGLDDGEISAVVRWYGVTDRGNFEGRNILHRPRRGLIARPPLIERAREALLTYRDKRVRPGLDDKVLTEWNALLLATLAEAAAATGFEEWRAQAVQTADFLLANLRRADGRWLRSWQAESGARHLAYAADYAALTDALTRTYELTGSARYLEAAIATADGLLALFADHTNGGFFTTGTDAEALITRPKDIMDNATPAASSMAATALFRLAALTGKEPYVQAADGCLRLAGELALRHPTAFGQYLCALDLSSGIDEIVIAGDRPDLLTAARETWRPNAVIAHGERFDSPLWTDRADGAAYVCRDFTCQLPATDADTLRRQLG